MMNEPILSLSHIKKKYSSHLVLDDVSIDIGIGECVGLVGKSGCGKSTLMSVATRMIPCDGGSISFRGEDITHASRSAMMAHYANMQMIFQQPIDSFDPRRAIGDSIMEPMICRGVPRAESKARVIELLMRVGLPEDYAERYPHEVSGGECQRAAIARAIAMKPMLLFCDEITSALDATVQKEIIILMRELIHENHMASLFVTHDIALLPGIADCVAVMAKGRIVERGTTSDVIAHPKSDAAKELIDAADLW